MKSNHKLLTVNSNLFFYTETEPIATVNGRTASDVKC